MSPLSGFRRIGLAVLVIIFLGTAAAPGAAGQRVGGEIPSNLYTLAEEAAIGREAAAALRGRVPIVADRQVDAYLNARVARLVQALPGTMKPAGFDYRAVPLNTPQLVSVALPGGPLFISAGMIDLAPDDAALAGLLAHELAHIALRHSTAQVSRGERYQIGEISGRAIAAAAAEQGLGILDRGAQFGVTSYFLAYDAGHESQADRLAGEMLQRAGYPASAVNVMFDVALADGAGRAGPWWTLRHPSKRRNSLETAASPASTPASRELASVRARVRALAAPQPSASTDPHARPATVGTVGYSVMPPSGEWRSVTAGDLLQLSVPANWDRMPTGNTVVFAPAGAYVRTMDGATAVTHGLQVGIARSLTGTLHGDIHTLLAAFGRNNRSITWTAAFREVRIGRRPGLTTTVSNVSPVTGEFETVFVYAIDLPDGSLLYAVGVAPQLDASAYGGAFLRVLDSMQILE